VKISVCFVCRSRQVCKHGLERLPVFPVLVFEIKTQNKSGSYVMVLLLTLSPEGKMFTKFLKFFDCPTNLQKATLQTVEYVATS